jgi:hypothetical protein
MTPRHITKFETVELTGATQGWYVRATLTGHSGGGVGRSYGGGFGSKALAEALGRIEVPEAVRGLEWALGR